LIVLATLFVRATLVASTIDVGFDAAGVYAVSPRLANTVDDGARIRSFWAQAIPELHALPGVAAVTLAELTPFSGITRSAIAGDKSNARIVYFNRTRADFFEAIKLRVVAGRTFTGDEVAARAPVALVSQSLARVYFHGESALGRMLPEEIPVPPAMILDARGPSLVSSPRPVIVGVVADAITARLHERNAFAVYEPLDPATESVARLLIRVAPGAGVIDDVARRLRALDPRVDFTITSVDALVQQEASRPRMLAVLTGVVGTFAIVLCAIGLYGLTAAVIAQRMHEMGIRVALGAKPRDVLHLLMRDSLRPVVVGLAIGVGAALLAGRVAVAAVFFGVSPHDPIAVVGAALILVAAAMLAVLVPTRRAAAIDAAVVLRRS
jgi:ABC-type antimicrobial peptide transport system permease subunit